MTKEEQLRYCKNCTNRELDLTENIVCGLTKKQADFETKCESFNFDSSSSTSGKSIRNSFFKIGLRLLGLFLFAEFCHSFLSFLVVHVTHPDFYQEKDFIGRIVSMLFPFICYILWFKPEEVLKVVGRSDFRKSDNLGSSFDKVISAGIFTYGVHLLIESVLVIPNYVHFLTEKETVGYELWISPILETSFAIAVIIFANSKWSVVKRQKSITPAQPESRPGL